MRTVLGKKYRTRQSVFWRVFFLFFNKLINLLVFLLDFCHYYFVKYARTGMFDYRGYQV